MSVAVDLALEIARELVDAARKGRGRAHVDAVLARARERLADRAASRERAARKPKAKGRP